MALFRQRKQTWISQGFLLKAVQSLVSGERENLRCVRSEVRCPLPGWCRITARNCVFLACLPTPDLVSETQPRLWGIEEGVGERRRLGTKAKKVVGTRVQGTSKQLRTMKCWTRETRTTDVALDYSPGNMTSKGKWVKVGGGECGGGSRWPGNRLASTLEHICQVMQKIAEPLLGRLPH